MTKFDFAEFGRVYIPIDIKPYDDTTMLREWFKVDTGADSTTISKESLANLGYDIEWIRQNAVAFEGEYRPTTASGEKVNAGCVQLPLINILGYEGRNWPFHVILDDNQDFRNLLGRDLLAGFNYWFSNDDKSFTIERSKAFEPQYPFLQNQEINEAVSI